MNLHVSHKQSIILSHSPPPFYPFLISPSHLLGQFDYQIIKNSSAFRYYDTMTEWQNDRQRTLDKYMIKLIESDEWFSPFSLSEPLVERWAFERRAKREIHKMNAWASAIQAKKLSGEQIANHEKMSECRALVNIYYLSELRITKYNFKGRLHTSLPFAATNCPFYWL